MTSTPRPSSPPRFSFGATESGSSGPSYGSSFAAPDQARFISLSDAPTNASPEQLFSLFVGLAAEIHTPDLVGASSELENLVNKDVAISHIHTAYIGSGGSFTVRAWRLGRGGRSLALKSAMPSSYTFTEKDERQRLTDIIMELRALSHPSLRGRDHVVKLLGLGWETDSFEEVRKWPVLILELAEGGTLMDLLRRKEESLGGQGKLNICLDVAMGLASLQECGIIHGDLKPQNVLMFLSSPGEENDLKWTAKLGDFGGAVLDLPDNSLNVLRTGTQPWNAPEWRELLKPAGMMLTDVYSLGLVFWSIAADGADPFRDHAEILGLREESTHFERNRDIQDLKHRGPHFLTKLCEAGRSSLCATDLSLMERLLSLTVQLEPNLRRLESVIDCLSEATERQYVRDSSAYTAPTSMPSHKLKSMEDVLGGANELDTLDPTIRAYAQKRLEDSFKRSSELWQKRSAAFTLAMEVPGDLNVDEAGEKCLCWLREAAEMGNQSAQSLCYRFHQTLAGEAAEEYSDKFKDWIIHAAQRGYPAAQEDLSLVANSEEQNQVRQRLRTRYGGTGWNRLAPCYSEDEISIEERDIKLRTFLKRKFDEAKLDPNIDFRINTQGDNPLHFAASAGAITTISLWEETRPIGINTRGGDEETPLLIACRSGHYKIACAIMELEGDPTIANQSGETPLHWLLSFDERYMAEIASRLCAKGADQNAPALGIKFDFAPECNFEAGTPLHRAVGRGNMAAVDALLKVGAKADFDGGREDRYTPLNLAAFLHYPEILDSLLGSLSQVRPAAHLFTGMSLLIPAIKGEYLRGEKFSRIARHGNLAWSRTSKTLDVLLEQGATEHLHTFPEGSLGAGCTPLFWATARGDPKVVKYLLDHGCKEDVNTPSRLFPQHTLSSPLHRAITSRRKSTFDVLLEYGANCLILHVNENGYKLTYLYECASAGHADSSMAEKLLSKGIPIDASPKDYETPFACAVRNRCFNLASYLLERGANSHVEYSQGFMFELEYPSSILGVLIKEQSISTLVCLDYLFAQAEPPNFIVASANGFTVLHAVAKVSERGRDDAACQLTTLRLLEIFKPDKAQINQKTLTGHTAIHFAAIAANVSVARELVKRGADPTIEDNEGVSAIDWIQMVLGAFDETSDLYVDPADPRPEENQIAGARRRREDILRLFEVYDDEEVG